MLLLNNTNLIYNILHKKHVVYISLRVNELKIYKFANFPIHISCEYP
jgi:hypothetical protein